MSYLEVQEWLLRHESCPSRALWVCVKYQAHSLDYVQDIIRLALMIYLITVRCHDEMSMSPYVCASDSLGYIISLHAGVFICVTRPLCLVKSHTLDATARRERFLFTSLTFCKVYSVALWDQTEEYICIHLFVFHSLELFAMISLRYLFSYHFFVGWNIEKFVKSIWGNFEL